MPSRIFTFIEVTVDSEGYSDPPSFIGTGSHNFSNSNFGTWSFNGIRSINDPLDINAFISFGYEKLGTIDFQPTTNPIPDGVLITEVKIRTPVSCNVQSSGTSDVDTAVSFDVILVSFTGGSPLINQQESENGPGAQQISHIDSILGSDADTIFDHSANPLSVAELISTYSSINLNMALSMAAGPEAGAAVTDCDVTYNISLTGWQIEVTYEETYQWTVSQANAPVDEGDTVTITSPELVTPPTESLDMDQITDIDIVFPDPDNPGMFITVPVITFTALSPNLLTFIIPSFGVYQPITFAIVIQGTQFSGSLDLGALWTIYFLSASGLYQLEVGKTNDTLYIEDQLPDTIDVKIPNPTMKTGYING